jgi:hypothetical protein
MAAPDLKKADFPMKLHKKKSNTDPAKIEGTGIMEKYKVKVVGHHGKKPTVWQGTIKAKISGDLWLVEDLTVQFEEEPEDRDRGTEDVSVTVTNGGGEESQPVIAKAVPIIP